MAAGHAVMHGGLIGGLLVAVLHTATGTWVVAASHAVTVVLEGEVLAAVGHTTMCVGAYVCGRLFAATDGWLRIAFRTYHRDACSTMVCSCIVVGIGTVEVCALRISARICGGGACVGIGFGVWTWLIASLAR